MDEWIIAVLTLGITLLLAVGGIMWRQGRSEGKLSSEIKTLSESFKTYAEKNDQVIIICTKAIGENAEDIAYLKGRQNGQQP